MASNGKPDQPLDSSTVPRYSEVATFMRAPRTNELTDVDIGMTGVPFQLGTSIRIGSYAGPAAVREFSRLVRRFNQSLKFSPFDIARIADVGDAPHNPLSIEQSLDLITAHFERLVAAQVRPLAVGGDHTITLAILRALAKDRPLALIDFDAHLDTWDEVYGERISSGSIIRRAIEEGLIDPQRTVQIGLRGTQFHAGEREEAEAMGIHCITQDLYEEKGRTAVIEEIHELVGDHEAYLTFDMDSLDPAFAPGTAGPEPGGLTTRDAQVMLRSLVDLRVVAADVVEIAPALDPTGMTVHNATQLMFEVLCILASAVQAARIGEAATASDE